MSPIQDRRPVDAPQRFRLAKIMTMSHLMALLGCSRSTVQRRLRQWGCHTSYNLNGRYYALPDVVRFDRRGLWRCGRARFSVHGNLGQTVAALVGASSSGMTAAELSAELGMNAHSFLWGFVRRGTLARARMHGRFVYFSADREHRGRQRDRRAGLGGKGSLSDADAVTVLVAFIKEPILGPLALAERVRARAPTATPAAIERLFAAHGLERAKKGAPRSRPSNCSSSIGNG